MAALQHGRTRSTAGLPRPQQRAAPDVGPAQYPTGKSPLSLFLTNLRLLDLDLLPDWPDISLQTFTASTQSQKRRVQCVEWALFHLFSLWDPDEATNKLKPYFPPLDQLQSLNLRAALLRALENVKKSGVLGRDCIIRKTMLDECRGDRFEEVLACLSTAVLKEKAAQGTISYPPASAKLSLKNRGYRSDNADLIALTLAHRVSLCRLVERKEVARTRYLDFARLLGDEERAVARRREAVRVQEEQCGFGVESADIRAEMDRKVRANWSADDGWIDVLLGSPSGRAGCTGLVAAPFDKLWRRVQQGRLLELQSDGAGLLEQLNDRVRTQKERLKRWHAFRADIFGNRQESKQPHAKAEKEVQSTKGLDIAFLQHQNLQIQDSNDGARGIGRRRPRLTDEYAGLVQGLRDELAQIRYQGNAPRSLLLSRKNSAHPHAGGSASEMSTLGDDPSTDNLFRGTTRTVPGAPTGLDGMTKRLRINKSKHDAELGSHVSKELWELSTSPSPSPCPSPTRRAESVTKRPSTDERSPPQALAKPSLAAVDDAQGPLEKRNTHRHTLSLSQRTCLSMTRADSSSIIPEDSEPEPALHKAATTGGGEATVCDHVADDLVNRTRRSMAGMEKAKQKARLERRRSERKAARTSPRKESALFPTPEEEPERTLMSALDPMDEEDMEAVFRSRPKVTASPIASPTREWDEEDA